MKVGDEYTGDELLKLCGADKEDCRYMAVVGSKATVIASDIGNDNYRITHVVEVNENEMDYAAALTVLEAEGVNIDPKIWAEALETAKTGLRYLVEKGE